MVRKGLQEAQKVNGTKTIMTQEAEAVISEYSEGYPNFIQQFAYCAFNQDNDDQIDESDVKTGAFMKNRAFYQLGVKYF